MASSAISSSTVPAIRAATRETRECRLPRSELVATRSWGHVTEIESNSGTKGKASGMTLQGKGKRKETWEARASPIEVDYVGYNSQRKIVGFCRVSNPLRFRILLSHVVAPPKITERDSLTPP